ncbi:MAG: LptF/LptG family permease [Opitutales bacterium]|jgi:lipopolysaccharide export LptBFGC system permease protein LptF
MTLIEKYVFREWLKAFVLVLGFLCGLTLLQNLADNLVDFRDNGVPKGDVAKYYFALLPGFLPWLIPISLFVSILLSYGAMSRRNEIVAMRACGTSLPQASRLVLLASFLMAGCVYGLNAKWAPWSVEETRKLKERFRHQSQARLGMNEAEIGSARNVSFDNKRAHRLWHLNWFSEVTQQARDIQVFVRDSKGTELYRISADMAWRDEEKDAWVFRDGRYLSFRTKAGLPRYSSEEGMMLMDLTALRDENSSGKEGLPRIPELAKPFDFLELRDFDEDPSLFALLRKKPKDLSLDELNLALEAFPENDRAGVRPFAIRRREILLAPLGCLFAAVIAIPFATIGSRRSPAVGIARAFSLVVAYYLVLTAANSLGKAGVLSADLAGSLPSIAMAMVAGWLLWRSR